ncbi:MAG: hypothetical protein CUN55_21190, partial [Phototrophicales bacterium]
GIYYLKRGDYTRAEHALSEAIEIAQKSGESASVLQAALARVYIAQKRADAAHRQVQIALRDRQITDGSKADLYAHLAHFYLTVGDHLQAKHYAERAYDFAWADGYP